MLESFETNVWSMRFRCMNCHTEGTPQNDKLVKEHGERVAWFKKGGPEATMEYLLASKLIDIENPEKSLLLTKPLNEVKHGGGIKFVVGDQGYKAFRAWIEDVAAIKTGKYAKAADLPPKETGPKQFGTEIVAQARQDAGRVGRQAAPGERLRLGREGEGVGEGTDRHVGPRGVGQGEAVAAHGDAARGAGLRPREGVGEAASRRCRRGSTS